MLLARARLFDLMSCYLACFGEGDLVEVEVGFGLMVFGEDAFADDASIGRRTFCDENDNLTKLLIGTFTDDKRCRHVRTQLTLELFCLNFQPTRADDIVLSSEDTELTV